MSTLSRENVILLARPNLVKFHPTLVKSLDFFPGLVNIWQNLEPRQVFWQLLYSTQRIFIVVNGQIIKPPGHTVFHN